MSDWSTQWAARHPEIVAAAARYVLAEADALRMAELGADVPAALGTEYATAAARLATTLRRAAMKKAGLEWRPEGEE